MSKGAHVMSKELVNKFYDRLSQDEKMQQDYNEAIARGLLEAAAAFATSRGFDLSPEDLSEKLQSRSNELSEGELGSVAGGMTSPVSGFRSAGEIKHSRPGDVLAGLMNLDEKA
jgi:predicted ribosomally synthesized peptide with nif11-like leader